MNIKPEKTKKKKSPRPPKEITPEYLEKAGLFYLQRFPASTQQFRDVMTAKIKKSCNWHKEQKYGACMQMLDELVVRLTDVGVLNDALYARAMVTSYRRQGKSRRAIVQKLKIKGLDSDLIGKALEEHDTQDNEDRNAELEAALVLARKKRLGPFQKDNDKKENDKEKALGVLGRAGFSYDVAGRVLDMEREEAEELIRV